ncbi:MAG: radical SAM protein [Sulfolobales archaeon]
MGNYEVIITSDRTMMSNHHGKEFLGFLATGPAIGLPEKVWMWLAAPKVKVDDEGKPIEAPYGLRKIEAKLVDEGFKAAIIDPDHLRKHLESIKVLMIGHHDYFAYGPPSNEWWLLTGKEPINRVSFMKFMRSDVVREAKRRGAKIIVGGPAAWQWLWELNFWKECGVDTVIDGEAERVICDIVRKALNGDELPDYLFIGPYDTPSIEEIPVIKGASVNGLIEVMRGCPRGCRFCSVTLRPLRNIPLNIIEEEIHVNLKSGVKSMLLHSEDVLLYGSGGVKPKPEPLIKLHELVRKCFKGTIAWSHASLASIKYSEENFRLVSKLMNDYILNEQQVFLGVEVGIETGSPRLAKSVMPAKAAPYPSTMWPKVVEDSFSIMHENNIIPAATLIIGLPGETSEDVVKTAELIDRLKYYRSIIVPMFFVPMGGLKSKDWFKKHYITSEHIDLMLKIMQHTIYWAEDIMNKYYVKEPHLAPVRLGLKLLMQYIKWRVNKVLPTITAMVTR